MLLLYLARESNFLHYCQRSPRTLSKTFWQHCEWEKTDEKYGTRPWPWRAWIYGGLLWRSSRLPPANTFNSSCCSRYSASCTQYCFINAAGVWFLNGPKGAELQISLHQYSYNKGDPDSDSERDFSDPFEYDEQKVSSSHLQRFPCAFKRFLIYSFFLILFYQIDVWNESRGLYKCSLYCVISLMQDHLSKDGINYIDFNCLRANMTFVT